MRKCLFLLLLLSLFCTACSGKNELHTPEVTEMPIAGENIPPTLSPDSMAPTVSATAPCAQTANPTPTVAPQTGGVPISKMYIDIIKSNNYFMKAKVSGVSNVSEFAVSVSSESTAMETHTNGVLYNTVIKGGVTYMIDHQSKIVITSSAEVANSASNMAGDKLVADGITFVNTTNGTFDGQSCSYDEYNVPSGGTMRFYFNDHALVGIESSVQGLTTRYSIEELSAGHRSAMHNIPADYQLLDMASLGG